MPSLQYVRSSSTAPYGTPAQPASGWPSLPSLFFGIQIGPDTSNNFALSLDPGSLEIGLAVRTPGGRFLRMDRRYNRLIDVTSLVISINPWAYRLPVRPEDVTKGDLIVTADPPDFSALFVLQDPEGDEGREELERRGRIVGLDIGSCQEVEFISPKNPFLNFCVRVVSLFDVLSS